LAAQTAHLSFAIFGLVSFASPCSHREETYLGKEQRMALDLSASRKRRKLFIVIRRRGILPLLSLLYMTQYMQTQSVLKY
jgi:hypothetical protein